MIAHRDELAAWLQQPVDPATADLYLGVAEGLVVAEIGARSPWPEAVKGVQLSVVARALDNPTGRRATTTGSESATMAHVDGVYLSGEDKRSLRRAVGLSADPGPAHSFPAALCWPDPVRP